MKNLFFIALAFFMSLIISYNCTAQERSSVSVSYGFGNGKPGLFRKYSSFSIKGQSLGIFGINYFHEVSRNIFFETGIQLFHYHYKDVESRLPSENYTMNLVSAPFKLRFAVGDHIFFNGGLTADIGKLGSDNIKGIGTGLGIGLQTKLVDRISLYINPQLNIHNVFPRGINFYEAHIAFGVAYRISGE